MKRRHRERGQSLVEFALVFPFFALLLFGIVDLGRYVYTMNALNEAAREGARAGVVAIRPSPECDGLSRAQCVQQVAAGRMTAVPVQPADVVVSCRRVNPNGTIGSISVANCRTNDFLGVTVPARFSLVTPLIAQFLGTLDLSGQAEVTVNQ